MRRSNFETIRALLLVGAACGMVAASPALAQVAASPAADDEGDDEEGDTSSTDASPAENQIIVTGSRIARRDYTATSPIVTVDSELLEESSAVNIEANLNKLPQFAPALTQFDTQGLQANANVTIGVATISLRQLGSNRNLVLVDGRRPTPINGSGVVDANAFRVLVTGGS